MTCRRLIASSALTGLATGAAACLLAGPAQAASTLVIEGRGFGHGVGMSQYGAYGFAKRGADYREILAHYYRGTAVSTLPSAPEIGVLLATGRRSVSVSQADRVGTVRLDPRRSYRIVGDGTGGVVVKDGKGRKIARAPGAVRVSAGGGAAPVRLRGTAGDGLTDAEYRGALAVRPETVGGLSVVNAVGLEDYVRGVVAAESPSQWPAEALRAQAVAARTYALTTDAGSAGDGYTQYADTRSQVYHGVAAETATTDAAVRATARELVTYQGRAITAFFFSTSGGRTENVEHGFPGATPQPYLVSVRDPYDTESPRHTWKVRLTLRQAEAKLGGLVKGSLKRITVLERGVSPRIVRARIVGSRGRTEVDGGTLRRRLALDDTWARFSIVRTTASRRTVRRTIAPAASTPAAAALRAAPAGGGPAPGALPPFDGWASFGVLTQRTGRPATGAAPAAPAPRTRRIRIRELQGRVTGRRRAVTLRVERGRGDGRWQTVGSVRTSARGFYLVRVPGPGLYRVRTKALIGPPVRAR